MSQFAAASKNPPWARNTVTPGVSLPQSATPSQTSALANSLIAAQSHTSVTGAASSVVTGPGLAAVLAAQSQSAGQPNPTGTAFPTGLAALSLAQNALQSGAVLTQQPGIALPVSLTTTTPVGTPGIALPTTLATTQVATVSYPAPRLIGQATVPFSANQPQVPTAIPHQHSSQGQPQHQPKQRVFTGTVTKLHDNFGFVDEDVFFQTRYNPNMPFKWNAVRIQVLPNQLVQSTSNNRGVGLGAPGGLISSGGITLHPNPSGLSQNIIPAMPSMGNQTAGQYSSITGGVSVGNRISSNFPPIRRHSPPLRRDRDRDIRREEIRRDDRRDRYREREIEKESFPSSLSSRKRSRSPRRASHSPPRRKPRVVPRYTVQIPKISLDLHEGNVMELRKRYSSLYIPSDFFSASFLWQDAFPPHRPFSLDHTCTFHVMSKDVDPVGENDAILEPTDVDHRFSAKVMLMANPSLQDIYHKSCALAEDPESIRESFVHPTRLISFLVGLKGKNETMAIGGPWSPSLDGPDPDKDPRVLIQTAVRTCKALTGIDLSKCTQWYRFAEIYYRRGESNHKGRLYPARVETVVIFLPDVWSCLPTQLEWDGLVFQYKNQLQRKLHEDTEEAIETQAEDEEGNQEEQSKKEPTHHSELDPKTMKVNDLRRELEARNLSTKGLKSQLIARLTKALRSESEKEEQEEAEHDETMEDSEKQDSTEEEEKKKKEEEDKKQKEEQEKATLEKKYILPDSPAVIVHPSRSAKNGKFDCTVMSLSVLLDYRQEDNKENSFEVSLFAELFNEMLMRDFGFHIYRALVDAPEVKEEDKEKKKETKRNEKDEKDEKKKKSEEGESTKEDEDSGEDNGDVDRKDTKSGDRKKKDKEKKKDKKVQMYTINPHLLLSCVYFDQNHCGYILEKDTEEILHTLGLHLSRAQVRKLLQKVIKKENFYYRKFTDNSEAIYQKLERAATIKQDSETDDSLEKLAKGNKLYLPLVKWKPDEENKPSLENGDVESSDMNTTESKNQVPPMVMFQGALLDIEKLMEQLKRSERARADTELRMKELQVELDETKELATSVKELSDQLSKDLENTKQVLKKTTEELKSSKQHSDKYQRSLTVCMNHIRTMQGVINTTLGFQSSSTTGSNTNSGSSSSNSVSLDEPSTKVKKEMQEDKS
ncbi:cell division cycle and apoptosis regulator protein 1-like [Limulus polyphemus]|uniref:Cell division cycle and apoptosis regulator protein 1-like n=1 Tax=Limulus polyphemus TaxID=6850 RepID=A0ABM1B3E1_LIMPO|nr:cell division cycle and apoptosis regulator protein 1-like [Limulus polyphemus]